jgi:hypothetical protein
MTVTFTTTGQGIFARLGKLFGALTRMETFQSDIVDASGTSVQEALQEYINSVGATANTDIQYTNLLTNDLDALRNEIGGDFIRKIQAVAERTLIEMMQADLEGETPATGLPSKTVYEALYELREQMIAGSKTLDGTTVTIGSTAAGGSNVGNGTVIVSAEADNAKHSTTNQIPTTRTETLSFRCIKDARSRKLAKGGEVFEVRGAEPFMATDHRWPGGSGYVGRFQSTSPIVGEGTRPGRNILRNSSFESFVSNVPRNWTATTGTGGSHIYEETSTVALGSSALKLASNGSTNICIQQKFGDVSAGTGQGVKPDALYGIAVLARKGGTTSSAGALTIGLANSSKTFATGNSIAISHGDLSASAYGIFTGSFRARTDLADPIYLTIEQTTAFTNGTNVFIDGLVLAEMIPTAPGGAHFLIVPGPTAFNLEDSFSVAVTNNGEGLFHKYMDRVFNTYQHGIFMPSNLVGGENVADTLIA